ncbi:STAS domain-containing protein [Nocardia sp. NPDC050712]|uniref:STAS domain-containing protein n=1 Tax=Nocardia sp. NPDC050712 TaxID=3155518 RepID=UPI0033D6C377
MSQRYSNRPSCEVWCFPEELPPRVVLRGDIDITANLQLEAAYQKLEPLAPSDVVLDLAEVTFLGCSALRLVVALTARLSPTGHKVTLRSPSLPARRLLELAEFL